ncbi:MAG: hypothetical protein PVH68_11995 [Armatimonadota bacterium]|jgi:hypothetical protein
MRPYDWKRTLALWLAGGVLVGGIVACIVLLLARGGGRPQPGMESDATPGPDAEFAVTPGLQVTSGPYRATLERVWLDAAGPRRRLHLDARIERTDGTELAPPAPPWSVGEMAHVTDGAGNLLSEWEPAADDSTTVDGRGYALQRSWVLSRQPVSPLRVTLCFPSDVTVTPDAAVPLNESDVESIVQAAGGSPSVLVRSVVVVEELDLTIDVPDPGPYLVVVIADLGRIRGTGPMPAIRIAVRDDAGRRMDRRYEWVRDAPQPEMPPDLWLAYPIADRAGPFVLELTSDETYREGLVEFTFEPVEIK